MSPWFKKAADKLSAADFSLREQSGARDAADTSSNVYITGEDITQGARPVGAGYDLGAYEYRAVGTTGEPTPKNDKDCPAGKYSGSDGKSFCTACSKGQYQVQVCASLTISKECPILSTNLSSQIRTLHAHTQIFSKHVHLTFHSPKKCKPVPIRSFPQPQDKESSTECKPCPEGKFSSHDGAVECLFCPPGTHANSTSKDVGKINHCDAVRCIRMPQRILQL